MSKTEIDLGSGLKYTEETGSHLLTLPKRDCLIWKEGVDDPVTGLGLVSFRQRFGAIAVPSEGVGGVRTLPDYRRKGYVSTLLTKVLESAAGRVPVVYVSEAIGALYEKFGWVNCLAVAHLTLRVRDVERMAATHTAAGRGRIRPFSENDLPAMIDLYNEAHAFRPWTHVRHQEWNRLLPTSTWNPGSEVIILERDDRLVGYAILKEPFYGWDRDKFEVDELTAVDVAAAQTLLAELAGRCWKLRKSEFTVREPSDSFVGTAARALGCSVHTTYPATGEMMGAILDRRELLNLLEPELRRRLPYEGLLPAHQEAVEALANGELIPDDKVLLRLLVGHSSMADALSLGTAVLDVYQPICHAWFPGGGTKTLPIPYSSSLDHY